MKRTLFFKNLVSTYIMLLLSFLLLGGVFASWSYRYILNEHREEMAVLAVDASHTVGTLSHRYPIDDFTMSMTLSILRGPTDYQILMADASGSVVSCSESPSVCTHHGKQLPSTLTEYFSSENETFTSITSLDGVYTSEKYVVSVPVEDGGRLVGYILVSVDPSAMSEMWRRSSGMLILVAIIVMEIAFIISFISTKRTTRPIKEMTNTVRQFARGNFSSRVYIPNEDEIGDLADSFNLMADSLERSENLRREFIANISHELKTPMTTISGFADGIMDGTIPPEKAPEYLAIISSETHRLSRLVRNMLDASQLSAKEPSELRKNSFELTEVVVQTLLSLEQKITARKLDVDAELPEEPIVTLGDRDSITQVVYNLLDNAAKFAQEWSVIKLSVYKQSGRAYVSVENRGNTIPEKELPLIFDRFHKTDKSRNSDKDGVGLGLYIVKTILDNHREDIFVTSADGVTKFTFTLTIAPQK